MFTIVNESEVSMKVTIKGSISSQLKQQVYSIIANTAKGGERDDLRTNVKSA